MEELEKDINKKNKENSDLKRKVNELEKETNKNVISNNNELIDFQVKLKEKDISIKNLEQKIIELNALIQNRNNINITNNNKELQKLYAKLDEKDKEIENLNNQLIGSIKYDDIKKGDNLIAINFTSCDQKINFPIICKANSLFAEVELSLYKKYPEYGTIDEDDKFFLGNGVKIKRLKTLSQNGFPGYAITLMQNKD